MAQKTKVNLKKKKVSASNKREMAIELDKCNVM